MILKAIGILTILFVHQLLWAQASSSDGVLFSALKMSRDTEKKTTTLKGDVQIIFQGQHLSCNEAIMDEKNQRITAVGNVVLRGDKIHVEGAKIIFNYKKDTGIIYDGFVQSDQVVFEGDVIEKMSKTRYIASNAEYTACETCPPAWSFSGRKIDAELGGYARIKRPIFRIGGIPVLILPSIIVPLKSQRQSGVLVPTMDYSSRGGLALSGTYFWAIDKSRDLTLTPKWYSKRGMKGLADYRYVMSESSKGNLQGAYIRDRAFREELSGDPYFYTKDIGRWVTTYGHHYEMPGDYVHRVNIKQISDLRYLRDFPEEVTGYGDPALENKTSITKSSDSQYGSAEVDVYTNLLHAYPLSPNDDAVHRFPHVRYNVKEQRLGELGPYFTMNMDYVNFQRGGSNYDDLQKVGDKFLPLDLGPRGEIQRDGEYDAATDLMRTGQRLDVTPRFSYPFQIARRFDIMPSVTLRETQYRFSPPDSARNPTDPTLSGFSRTAARRYVQTDLLMKTEFHRVFGNRSDPKSNRWKHTIEPELSYSHIPWIRRPDHPFFGNDLNRPYSRQFEPLSDTDLSNRNVQFDYHDRSFEKQVVDLAITNRLLRKLWLNGAPDYQPAVRWRLSQSYDFNEARTLTPHPWSPLSSLLDARFTHFETYTTTDYDVYTNVFTNFSSRVRVMTTPQNFFQVSFTRSILINPETYQVVKESETRNVGLGVGILTKYLEGQGGVDISTVTNQVNSSYYAVILKPPGKCWTIAIDYRKLLGGDSQIHGSLNFEFGGGPVAADPLTTDTSTRKEPDQPTGRGRDI